MDMGVYPGREMADDLVAISPGIRATRVSVVTREEMSWVISGWDAVPADAGRRLSGELARAIGSAAVPAGRAGVSDDGVAMGQ